MDNEIVTLRIVHIVAGVLWAGGAVTAAFVIVPGLESAGPDVMRQIGPKLGRRISIFLHATGLSTIVFGLILIARTPGRGFDQLFTNGWGWAIGIGLIGSVVGLAIGSAGNFAGMKAGKIGAQLKGPPDPATVKQIGMLRNRFRMGTRAAAVLIVISVGTMAAARYV